jgi:MFS family permease
MFGMANEQTAYLPGLFAGYVLLGLGGGVSFLPLLTISMSEVPMPDAGLASGFSNQVMQVGGAVGLAAIGTASTSFSVGEAGYRLAFLLAAASVAAGLAVVMAFLRPNAQPARPEVHEVEVEAA